MKIVQLRRAFEDNGPGTQSLTIAEELRRRGHEVTFVGSGGVLVDRILERGFDFVSVPTLAIDRRDPVSTATTIRMLKKVFDEREIDVAHAHNAAATYCAFLAGLFSTRRLKVVHSVRGVEQRPTHRWRNWIYLSYPATMLAVSEFTRGRLEEIGADRSKVVVTFNGVDLQRFDPDRVSGAEIRQRYGLGDKLIVGHVGAFSGTKGQDLLVRLVARLKPRHPRLHVLLVGDGRARPVVEKLAEELDVSDSVTFAGLVLDVPKYYAAFDVYSQPSVAGEMFPNSILEAMAMRTSWVGSAISGLPEMTGEGRAGKVVPPGDLDALCAAIEPLLAGQELREGMSAAARRLVEEQFTIERVVDRIEWCYESR